MPRPWQQHRWLSPLSADECAGRLADAAGATRIGNRRATLRVVVSLTGRTLALTASRGPWLLPGPPHLHAMLVRSPRGTIIVGRFNPGPLVLATGFLALLAGAIWIAGLGTDSSAFLRSVWSGLQRPMGAAAGVGAIGLIAVGVIRALTWQRDCADIAALLKQCCEAIETDPAPEV